VAPADSTDNESASTTGSKQWSVNKNERAEALKRRREEMILAARRKMMEKERQKTDAV